MSRSTKKKHFQLIESKQLLSWLMNFPFPNNSKIELKPSRMATVRSGLSGISVICLGWISGSCMSGQCLHHKGFTWGISHFVAQYFGVDLFCDPAHEFHISSCYSENAFGL
jgi:hypothetical protein